MSKKSLLSVKQLQDRELLEKLFKRANEFRNMSSKDYPKPLHGMTIASIFFEPSTRTRLSFETALQNLGAQLVTTENANEYSSMKKGESLEDTIRVIDAYADCIIMRHPEIGAAERAARVANVPIINGGDGGGDHPTQALLDVYSIYRMLKRIDGLKVGMVGDLLHSRTHHALMYLLSIYDVEFTFVSPDSLKLPDDDRRYLKDRKISFEELNNWDNVLDQVDVIYINRIQKERFTSTQEYESLKGSFQLTKELVSKMKKDAIILDPLPRVDEIDPEVDSDPRARYFEQVKNGLYVRMALLELLLS